MDNSPFGLKHTTILFYFNFLSFSSTASYDMIVSCYYVIFHFLYCNKGNPLYFQFYEWFVGLSHASLVTDVFVAMQTNQRFVVPFRSLGFFGSRSFVRKRWMISIRYPSKLNVASRKIFFTFRPMNGPWAYRSLSIWSTKLFFEKKKSFLQCVNFSSFINIYSALKLKWILVPIRNLVSVYNILMLCMWFGTSANTLL